MVLDKETQLNDRSASTHEGLIRRDAEVLSSTMKRYAQNFRQDTAHQTEADPKITEIKLRLKQSGETRLDGSCLTAVNRCTSRAEYLKREREEKQLLRETKKTKYKLWFCHEKN